MHADGRVLGTWDPHIGTDEDSVLLGRGVVYIGM